MSTAQIANDLAEEAIKVAQEEWDAAAEVNWTSLKHSASSFLKAYNNYINKKNFQQDFANSIINQLGGTELFGDESQAAERAVYILGFKFQYNLQRYSNELPTEVIYVTKSGSVYKGPIQQLALTANFDNSLNSGRVAGLSQVDGFVKQEIDKKLKDAYQNLIKRLEDYYTELNKKLIEKHLHGKQPFYATSKHIDKLTGEKKEGKTYLIKQKGIIKEGSDFYQILNYGDLGEALIAASKNNKNTEKDILEALLKVSNAAAILKEDVDNLAVKTPKASLPGIQQFVNTANIIKNSKKKINDEQIKSQIKSHKEGVRNKILQEEDFNKIITLPDNSSMTIRQLLDEIY